jgi:hypothetical protein
MTHPSFPATPLWAAHSRFQIHTHPQSIPSLQQPQKRLPVLLSTGGGSSIVPKALDGEAPSAFARSFSIGAGASSRDPFRAARSPLTSTATGRKTTVGRMKAHQLSSSYPHVVSPAPQQKPGLLPEYVKVERGLNAGSGCSARIADRGGAKAIVWCRQAYASVACLSSGGEMRVVV